MNDVKKNAKHYRNVRCINSNDIRSHYTDNYAY